MQSSLPAQGDYNENIKKADVKYTSAFQVHEIPKQVRDDDYSKLVQTDFYLIKSSVYEFVKARFA